MNTSVLNSNGQFSLQNCTDESVLLRFLAKLPFTSVNSGLKKEMLIWAIETEMSKGVIMSPKFLCLLEVVGELDYTTGKVASEKLREAYCVVALDCAAIHLEREEYEKYAETVQKIWRDRIPKMAQQCKFGLVDGKTLSWVDIIEGASFNGESRDHILSRNNRYETIKAIKSYLAEAYKEISPSIPQEPLHKELLEKQKAVGQLNIGSTGHENRVSFIFRGNSLRNQVRPRKKYTKWNIMEVVILIYGLEEFGLGQWETILNKYPDVFERRTEANLKDRWRTMTQKLKQLSAGC